MNQHGSNYRSRWHSRAERFIRIHAPRSSRMAPILEPQTPQDMTMNSKMWMIDANWEKQKAQHGGWSA
jgi:hypothetical protein